MSASALLALFNLGVGVLLLIQIWVRQGVNHWGFDVLWLCPLAVAGVLGGLSRAGQSWGLANLASGLLLLSLIGILDHYNLLVEHSRWCQRGMPSFGQVTVVAP